MVDPHDDPIALVDSRHEEWRQLFEAERDRLERLFDRRGLATCVHRIDHVGSTAVPDLAAKDIVDVDVVVADDAVADVSKAIQADLRGTRYENTATWQPVFRRVDGQRINDHVFGHTDPGWRISVATAAVLKERGDLRSRYERLKRREAAETDDLETYSRAKTTFVADLLAVADGLALGFEIPPIDESG